MGDHGLHTPPTTGGKRPGQIPSYDTQWREVVHTYSNHRRATCATQQNRRAQRRFCVWQGYVVLPFIEVAVESAPEHRVTELPKRLALKLAHALTGEAQTLADLL